MNIEEGFETDVVLDMPAVWKDFDQVRKKAGKQNS
jgi:hypothetical protein